MKIIVLILILTIFNAGCGMAAKLDAKDASTQDPSVITKEELEHYKKSAQKMKQIMKEQEANKSIPEQGIFRHDCRFKNLYQDLKDPVEMTVVRGNVYDPWLEHKSLDVVSNVKSVCVNQQGFGGATYLMNEYGNYVIVKILVSSWAAYTDANKNTDCILEIIYKKVPRSRLDYIKDNHIYVVDTGYGNILYHPVMVSSPNSKFFDEALWVCNGEEGFLKLQKGEYKKYI